MLRAQSRYKIIELLMAMKNWGQLRWTFHRFPTSEFYISNDMYNVYMLVRKKIGIKTEENVWSFKLPAMADDWHPLAWDMKNSCLRLMSIAGPFFSNIWITFGFYRYSTASGFLLFSQQSNLIEGEINAAGTINPPPPSTKKVYIQLVLLCIVKRRQRPSTQKAHL